MKYVLADMMKTWKASRKQNQPRNCVGFNKPGDVVIYKSTIQHHCLTFFCFFCSVINFRHYVYLTNPEMHCSLKTMGAI